MKYANGAEAILVQIQQQQVSGSLNYNREHLYIDYNQYIDRWSGHSSILLLFLVPWYLNTVSLVLLFFKYIGLPCNTNYHSYHK